MNYQELLNLKRRIEQARWAMDAVLADQIDKAGVTNTTTRDLCSGIRNATTAIESIDRLVEDKRPIYAEDETA